MGLSILGYYIIEELSPTYMQTLHWNIYIIGIFIVGILAYFNRSKSLFFLLSIILSYLLINNLKRIYGVEYLSNPFYENLCLFLPLNLLFFYFLPNFKFLSKENLYVLIGFLIELTIFEQFSHTYSLGWNYIASSPLTYTHLSLLVSLLGGMIILFKASKSGKIIPSYLLFAYIEVMFGLIYSDVPSALTMSFFAAIITLLIANSYEIYYATYHDPLTGLLSRNSFILNSKHFPMKYSIGIICVDDYARLKKIFRKHEIKDLIEMISSQILELESEENVYRYDEDEFVVLWKSETKDEAFQKMENIRRKIAAAEFILSQRKKPIKLTISAGISEKKRSDGTSFDVLVRTKKALEQTNKFSQNITSQA